MRALQTWHKGQQLPLSIRDRARNPEHEVPIGALACLLQDCIRRKDLVLGEHAHSVYVTNGLHGNSNLGCLLIRMFASCGSLHRACQVFDSMHKHNVYAWTAIILAHAQHFQAEQAIVLYKQMQWSSVKPSPHTFVAVLKACASPLPTLEQGKLTHADIAEQGLDRELFVGSALVGMYARCGSLLDARNVFDGLQMRDDVSWSVMIGGYVQHGHSWEAFELIKVMQQQGVEPNEATFLTLLRACTSIAALVEGNKIYSDIIKLGLESDIRIGSSLLGMYAKCDRLGDACKVFDSLPQERDVVSWNAMIATIAEHGCSAEAFQLFEKMKREGTNPNESTFVSLLRGTAAIDEGNLMYADIIKLGVEVDLRIQSSLVNMYVKCCCLNDARNVFNNVLVEDVVLWSTMMAGYVDHGYIKEANELYVNMQQKGIKPDEYTFVCLLQACSTAATLHHGQLIHADVVEQKLESNLFIGNNAVDMYIKCGSLECAQKVFDGLLVRDIVSSSAMIAGYADCGHGDKALQLFSELLQEIIEPDRVTFLCILRACSNISAIYEGTLIHGIVVEQGLDTDVLIGSTLVDMFAKCGSLEDACNVFEKLPTYNAVAYSAMISGYTEHGHHEIALQFSERMQEEGFKLDAITWLCMLRACSGIGALEQGKSIHADIEKRGLQSNLLLGSALVDMYAKCGNLEDTRRIFDRLHMQDVVSWSVILSGYVDHGCSEEAIQLFKRMQEEGTQPNEVTYLCILIACSTLGSSHWGMSIHTEVTKQGLESDPTLGNVLIDMYAKCGNLEDACKAFEDLKDRNLISWSTIISGCAEHGLFGVVNQHIDNMQEAGILPDDGIFVCLLCACSHAGLVKEGLHCFHAMVEDNHLIPTIEHYICMVDILGRAGCLYEAEELALRMPYQPGCVVWVVLLGSCAKHSNLDIAQQAFSCVVESDCSDVVAYVLMSNIYAASYMVEKAFEMNG